MKTLRTRLTLIFVAATAVPLAATLWMSSSLLERSLSYSSIARLDSTSRSLHDAGREYYDASRESLEADADAGRAAPQAVAVSVASQGIPSRWSATRAAARPRSSVCCKNFTCPRAEKYSWTALI